MNFLNKIAKAVSDQRAEKKSRISDLSELIYDQLKDDLVGLNSVVENSSATRRDLRIAGELVIARALDSAWKHGNALTDRQLEVMQRLSNALGISSDQMNSVIEQKARSRLVMLMQQRFASESLNEKDRLHFEHVLSFSGQEMNEVFIPITIDMLKHFNNSFARINWDNTSSAIARYKELVDEAVFFGFTSNQVAISAVDQVQKVIGNKISAINEKRRVSTHDVDDLEEIVAAFDLTIVDTHHPSYRDVSYSTNIRHTLQRLRSMTGLDSGRLPIMAIPNGITPKADETVHAAFDVTLLHHRGYRSRPEFYEGRFVVLNNHAIFQGGESYYGRTSGGEDFEFRYSSILELDWNYSSDGNEHRMDIEVMDEKTHDDDRFELRFHQRYVLDARVFELAVDLAEKSHLTEKKISERSCSAEPLPPKPSRHISKEVRARVWEAYGGRCVECGSNEYLVFDHIIPQAKGGSAEENNIQLLCKRCRLEKSDSV